jgi:hypothetical protein
MAQRSGGGELGLVRAGFVAGILGAACGIAGDALLTYSQEVPGGTPYRWEDVQALVRTIPFERQLAGHFLGVLGLPLSLLGFRALCDGIRPAGRAWWLSGWVTTVAVYVIGTVYHGQLALLGSALRALDRIGASDAQLVDQYFITMWGPIGAVGLGAGLLSLWFPAAVLLRPTVYPRWMAALSPGLLMGAIVGAAKLCPEPVRMFLELTVFNLAALILLVAAAAVSWSRGAAEHPSPG